MVFLLGEIVARVFGRACLRRHHLVPLNIKSSIFLLILPTQGVDLTVISRMRFLNLLIELLHVFEVVVHIGVDDLHDRNMIETVSFVSVEGTLVHLQCVYLDSDFVDPEDVLVHGLIGVR